MVEHGVMVCLIMSTAQVLKKLGLRSEVIPLLNILFGVLMALFWIDEPDLITRISQGLVLGLMSSGVYDAVSCFDRIN